MDMAILHPAAARAGGGWGVSPLCFLMTAFSDFARKYLSNFLQYWEEKFG
jgi:hypothetical protein